MRTVREDLATIRNALKEVNSQNNSGAFKYDENDYSDSFLYSLWKQERAVIFRNELNKKYPISNWDIKTVCIDLIKGNIPDCATCKEEWFTSKDIPRPISGSYTDTLKVRDEDGRYIGLSSKNNLLHESQNPILKNTPRYGVINSRIVIYNNKCLESIIIEVIPEDPLNDFFDIECNDAPTCNSEDVSSFIVNRVVTFLSNEVRT